MKTSLFLLPLVLLASCAGMPNGKKSPCPNKAADEPVFVTGYAEEAHPSSTRCVFQSFDLPDATDEREGAR